MTDNTWPAEFIVNGECAADTRLTPEQIAVIIDLIKYFDKGNQEVNNSK